MTELYVLDEATAFAVDLDRRLHAARLVARGRHRTYEARAVLRAGFVPGYHPSVHLPR